MIINLRGTNGSGKSTVARGLLQSSSDVRMIDLVPYQTKTGAPRHVAGYVVPALDLIVVGSYANECGGCDGIKTQDLIKHSVKLASQTAKHVFFEGVIISTLFSGYLELSKQLRHQADLTVGTDNYMNSDRRYIWAYLDTPLATCLQRIYQRNGGKPIKEDLVADKCRSIERTRVKAVGAGETVRMIDHHNATGAVLDLLRVAP